MLRKIIFQIYTLKKKMFQAMEMQSLVLEKIEIKRAYAK
jgi:hypothetical protein